MYKQESCWSKLNNIFNQVDVAIDARLYLTCEISCYFWISPTAYWMKTHHYEKTLSPATDEHAVQRKLTSSENAINTNSRILQPWLFPLKLRTVFFWANQANSAKHKLAVSSFLFSLFYALLVYLIIFTEDKLVFFTYLPYCKTPSSFRILSKINANYLSFWNDGLCSLETNSINQLTNV